MSAKKIAEVMAEQISRRTFLVRMTGAAFGLVLGLVGLNTPSAKASRQVACCNLLYDTDCPPGCECVSGWAWTCCYNGQIWHCFECHSSKCSRASNTYRACTSSALSIEVGPNVPCP